MKRLVTFVAFAAVLALRPAAPLQAQPARPKLVVLIAVDQMRGDYPERYAGLMTSGLKRLTTEGAWFRNAAYPYANTYTCVGHHTIGTGTLPYQHGMMQNAWYDRETGKIVTCTADPEATNYTAAGAAAGVGDSGARNERPSLADLMRRDLHSRVATISIKARSAIGLAGHGGDAVLWIDEKGALETSSKFGATVPAWAVAFQKANPVERDAGKSWERLLPADRYQYADDAVGEKPTGGWSKTFPHALGQAGDRAFFAHWEQSPFGDAYLEEAAEAAVDALKLGQEDRTDFLGISFSSLDIVGHAFGPRSHEVQDVLAHLDATIGRLLTFLDEKVGAGNYVLGLSADHGVADVPEQVADGARVLPPTVTAAIESAMKPYFGDGPFVASNLGADVYLKPGVYAKLAANRQALGAVRKAVLSVPGVARVITSGEVARPEARRSKDALVRAVALSYYPGRSGDLIVITKPDVLFGNAATTHGTPQPYDQHVPVILFGQGIKGGVQAGAATPADLVATLASMIGVKLPSPDGRVLGAALAGGARRGTAR